MLTHLPPPPAPPVQLLLHGYPAVLVGGVPVALKVKRALALVALLADAGRPVGRQGLAQLLWPDADAATGRGRLRRLLHELNGAIGHALVEGDGDALWLADGCRSDLQATQATMQSVLQASLATARTVGPLLADGVDGVLAGFELDADGFAEWLDARRRSHVAALQRALERACEHAVAARDAALADALAARLLQLDPCAESGHAARMAARALRGDEAGLETAYHDAAAQLRAELGVRPSARLETAFVEAGVLARAMRPALAVQFADTGHGEVAYVSWGQGPQTIVVLWGLISNLEVALEEPRARALLDRLALRHRIVMFDRRGTGLSERVGVVPDAANAARDIVATLDQLGVQDAWLFGTSVGGTIALDFALRHPERCAGLLLYGTSARGAWAPDWPWALRPEAFDAWIADLSDPGRYADSLRRFAPSVAGERAVQAWYGRLLRHAATRRSVVAALRAYQGMDLRARLPQLRVPSLVMHRRHDRIVPVEAGRWLAHAIPGAYFEAMDGEDHFHWVGDADGVVRHVERFVAGRRCDERLESMAA